MSAELWDRITSFSRESSHETQVQNGFGQPSAAAVPSNWIFKSRLSNHKIEGAQNPRRQRKKKPLLPKEIGMERNLARANWFALRPAFLDGWKPNSPGRR